MSNNDKKKDLKITIKLTEEHIMNMVGEVINPYISTKISKVVEIDDTPTIFNKEKQNVYIDGKNRLSTKIPWLENLNKMKSYYPEMEDTIILQKFILNMVKQLPDSHTIMECGKCRDKDKLEYIYLVALDNKIISFLKKNRNFINNIYFSNNIIESNFENGTYFYDNNIYITNKDTNKALPTFVVPIQLLDCTIHQTYGCKLFSSSDLPE